MRVELPSYPAYHPARVSWAKTIPLGWETGWLGECSSAIQTGPFGSQLHAMEYVSDGFPVINPSNIIRGQVAPDWEITVDNEKATSLKRHRFKLGDIVFARRGEMGRCAPISETEVGWLCGTGSMLVRLKEHRLLPQFASLLLSQAGVKDTLSLESVGATMDNLNTRILAKIRIPVPPLEDQRAILAFLDRETAKIDRLMAVRQKQVERLQEQRTAVIHHTVTKGLNPQARMKRSGVEWLGDVPEGWTTYRLRHLLRPGKDGIRIGPFGSALKAEFIRDDGYKVYGQENVIGRNFDLGSRYVDYSKFSELSEYGLRSDDLLITMMGSIGRCIVVPQEVQKGIIDSHLIRVGLDSRKVDPHYLALLIEDAPYVAACIRNESKGSIMDGLNSAIIKRLVILLPSIPEQQLVMAHIGRETAKLDTLISKYQRELELLAEYRASLISHAVTGKIDVRGLVESTPLEVA